MDDTNEVPEGVKQQVWVALGSYRARAEEIRRGANLARNPAIGGGRRYVDDARRNLRPPNRETVREFLTLARENGINGLAVVKSLAHKAFAGLPRTDPLAGIRAAKPCLRQLCNNDRKIP